VLSHPSLRKGERRKITKLSSLRGEKPVRGTKKLIIPARGLGERGKKGKKKETDLKKHYVFLLEGK